MRKILPFVLMAFIFSCSSKPSETALAEKNEQISNEPGNPAEVGKPTEEEENAAVAYSIDNATKADFDKAKKANSDALTPDTANSRKKDGMIQVLTNGKWKPLTAFKDTLNSPESDDDGIRAYKYAGQIKPINKYLVEGYFWEFYECYLVDKTTDLQFAIRELQINENNMKKHNGMALKTSWYCWTSLPGMRSGR